MRSISLFGAMALLAVISTTPASACGDDTVALFKSVAAGMEPMLYRCGPDFNTTLQQIHAKNWNAALTAYKAHLAGIGSWEAGKDSSKAALAYLEEKTR